MAVLLLTAGSALIWQQRSRIDHTVAPPGETAGGRYPWHSVVGSVFWIGEDETAENAFINNRETAWDLDATGSFGGVDDPDVRTTDGLAPKQFTPRHNTFYMALPAAEFTEAGPVAEARHKSYWSQDNVAENTSLFKGRWAEIYYNGQKAYVQWADVGPFEEHDYDYVFGHNKPKNTWGLGAGIDLSPATAAYLKIDGAAQVFWRFIDADQVPDGPWKLYPAITNQTNWKVPTPTPAVLPSR